MQAHLPMIRITLTIMIILLLVLQLITKYKMALSGCNTMTIFSTGIFWMIPYPFPVLPLIKRGLITELRALLNYIPASTWVKILNSLQEWITGKTKPARYIFTIPIMAILFLLYLLIVPKRTS